MHQSKLIINAKILGYTELQNIVINEKNIIEQITNKKIEATQDTVVDVAGNIISLGGVDLQINGGLGWLFPI